jgi:hypothetical protein
MLVRSIVPESLAHDTSAGNAERQQRSFDGVHHERRAAHEIERLCIGPRAKALREHVAGDVAVWVAPRRRRLAERQNQPQPHVGMQAFEFFPGDDLRLTPVAVDQGRRPLLSTRGEIAKNGERRSDPGASRNQDERAVSVSRAVSSREGEVAVRSVQIRHRPKGDRTHGPREVAALLDDELQTRQRHRR